MPANCCVNASTLRILSTVAKDSSAPRSTTFDAPGTAEFRVDQVEGLAHLAVFGEKHREEIGLSANQPEAAAKQCRDADHNQRYPPWESAAQAVQHGHQLRPADTLRRCLRERGKQQQPAPQRAGNQRVGVDDGDRRGQPEIMQRRQLADREGRRIRPRW